MLVALHGALSANEAWLVPGLTSKCMFALIPQCFPAPRAFWVKILKQLQL